MVYGIVVHVRCVCECVRACLALFSSVQIPRWQSISPNIHICLLHTHAQRKMSPPAGDPCSASPERQHVALDRSLTRASDQSTKDLQRSHLIGQQKELRAAIEAMRKDLEALPSRTAQQRLLEAERSLAELDAIYSAQNRNAEALLNIPGCYSESHKRAVRLIQWAWRERQLRRAMEAERRPFLELIGLPALSWRSLTESSTGGGGGGDGGNGGDGATAGRVGTWSWALDTWHWAQPVDQHAAAAAQPQDRGATALAPRYWVGALLASLGIDGAEEER